ncbi:MAG: DNA polymerase III subunit delta' [Actinobacteria bacterium]|nr:DNA polymerase III subunit delta' [Actinomycetota bacterium]
MTGPGEEGGRVFDRLVGQRPAVRQLRAAARTPVHAYLLVGPPGGGKRPAARAFAAALLCPQGGCGTCDVCTRVLSDIHPDAVVVEREGASISVPQAQEIRRLAMRSPNECHRKVLTLVDFHLVLTAGPTLLKIVEEPPGSTVFVILAEHVPPELVTIASRCVRIDFRSLAPSELVQALVGEGVDEATASRVAEAAGGRLDRARLLASDPGFEDRRRAWQSLPTRLDGTGATVSLLAAELVELLASAAVGPLEERHAEERAALEARIERSGERGSGRKQLQERHRRELRRLRADELRYGLALLADAYGQALAGGSAQTGRGCLTSLEAIQAAAEAIVRNPNELLFLQALLLKLAPLPATSGDGRPPSDARYSAAPPG